MDHAHIGRKSDFESPIRARGSLSDVNAGRSFDFKTRQVRPELYTLDALPIERFDGHVVLVSKAFFQVLQERRNRDGIRKALEVGVATGFLADLDQAGLPRFVTQSFQP